MKSKNKIAAVLVTYNRKELLLQSIKALLEQSYPLSAIYIINNASNDGTEEFLIDKKIISPIKKIDTIQDTENKSKHLHSIKKIKSQAGFVEIVYVRMFENTGGAGGFYEGIKQASKRDYDWLWIMDDDAVPENPAFEKLSKYFHNKDVVAIAGSVRNIDSTPQLTHRGTISFKSIFPLMQKPIPITDYKKDYLEIDMVSFVGVLVSVKAVKKIGLPKKEFFIHNDDVEYSIRLREMGKILFVPDCIITHYDNLQENRNLKKLFGKTTLRRGNAAIWLSYFGQRNLTWLGKKYCHSKAMLYMQIGLNFFRQLLGIVLYDEYKFVRTKCLMRSIVDGLKGNFDNSYPMELKKKKLK